MKNGCDSSVLYIQRDILTDKVYRLVVYQIYGFLVEFLVENFHQKSLREPH